MILSVAKEGQVRGRWTYGYRRVKPKTAGNGHSFGGHDGEQVDGEIRCSSGTV